MYDKSKLAILFLPTEIARIGDGKKIVSLEYIAEEQLIMVIAGRQRQVKLVPVRALGGDEVEWIKVRREGCTALSSPAAVFHSQCFNLFLFHCST